MTSPADRTAARTASSDPERVRAALIGWFREAGAVAVAVSGGVDSMTLAVVAHEAIGEAAAMFHACSPAVPPEATARVRAHAARRGWRLEVVDAGEFDDEAYLGNPVNRCYHCKRNLYARVAGRVPGTTVSGANTDDLGDYRPGLVAAAERRVRHPYIELGIAKRDVRALARHLGCDDLAELPASPCLSSRIETGIRIDAAMLAAVHAAERLVAERLRPRTVRCRVRRDAVVLELDEAALAALATLDGDRVDELTTAIVEGFRLARIVHPVRFETYRRGSAFLHEQTHRDVSGPQARP